MVEANLSALRPPVQLSTLPVRVFSIEVDLPPDVEAELQYRVDQHGTRQPDELTGKEQYFYRECFLPIEGHFPLLTEEILQAPALPQSRETLAGSLNEEFSRLRATGVLGSLVLHESIYASISRKLEAGEFASPMGIVFAPAPRPTRT